MSLCFKTGENEYLLRTALGLISASYLVLFLATYGWLDRNLILGLMIVVILLRVKGLSRSLISMRGKAVRFISNLNVFEKILFIILVLQIGINLFFAFTPPAGWDSLSYHLAVPKLILQEGRMIRYADYGGANFPLLAQMIFTLGLLVNGAGLVKLLCLGMSVLTVAAIYILASKINLKVIGLISGLFFYSTQVVSMWAGKCYIDITLAFFVISAVIMLIQFMQRKKASLVSAWLFIAVLPGIKYNGLIMSVIIGTYLIFLIFFQGKNIRNILKALSVGLLIILAVNSPWYFMLKQKEIGTDNTILYTNVLKAPSVLKNYLKRCAFVLKKLSLKCDRDGRIGHVFLALLPLLILIRPLKREIRLLLIFSLSYAAIFSFFGNLLPRYVIPIMPILGIVAAYVFIRLDGKDKGLTYFLRGCLIFSFIFNLGLTLYNHRPEMRYLTGKVSKEDFLTARVRCHPAITYINQNIRKGAVLFAGEKRVYYLNRPFYFAEGLIGRPLKEINGILRQKNVTHVLVNERIIYRVKKDPCIQGVLKYLDKHLEMVYHQGSFKVYRIEI